MSLRSIVLFGAALAAVFACRAPERAPRVAGEPGPVCEERKQAFVGFLARLPERSVSAPSRIDLPESSLGAVPGTAPVLELSGDTAAIEGEALAGESVTARAAAFAAWLSAHPFAGDKSTLYVAAARGTDIRTVREYLRVVPEAVELRLLVGTVAAPKDAKQSAPSEADYATRVLAERDPGTRRTIAEEGYRKLAGCPEFERAVASVSKLDARQRWSALRAALSEAAPRCACTELDTRGLEPLIAAEQRAGASSLGLVPAGFLRDERCGASMPLRSVEKLVQQMERFDREFAGEFREGAVEFNDVLANERLLNFFCGALPGETLASRARERATIYFKRAAGVCEGWRLKPLSPGAPMGTLERVSGADSRALSVHYWQGAEEIRLFGPVVEATSKPTDAKQWACDQNAKLESVDARSVGFEQGRWYFDEAACQKSPASEPSLPGCFGTLGTEQAAPTASP
jgi:hypothetical protein